jgi:hypothetical protein
MSNLEQRLESIVRELESMHPDDPETLVFLEKLTNLLLEDELSTIDLLKKCDNSIIIDWISPLLDEVSYTFASNKLLDTLNTLIVRFPHKEILAINVKLAIDVIRYTQK